MNLFKILVAVSLFILTAVNIFSFSINNPDYIQAKMSMLSPSRGNQYFGRLRWWYSLAKNGQWPAAIALEPFLDPADFSSYKSTHYPEELKKYINTLQSKPDKSVEDWLELARVQSILGQHQASLESLAKARSLDPVRDDLSQLYYQATK